MRGQAVGVASPYPISKALSISAAPRPRNSSFWRVTRESDRCSAVVAGEASGRQRPWYRSGQDVLRPGRWLRGFNTLLLLDGVDRVILRSMMGHCSEERR